MNRVAIFVVGLSLAGCASNPSLIGTSDPIIDTKGVDMNQYMIDKRECQAYASEVRRGEKIARGCGGRCRCRRCDWCCHQSRA